MAGDGDGRIPSRGRGRRRPFESAAPPRPDDLDAAESAAVRILGGAGQSQAGLSRKLSRRGFDDVTAAAAVAAMVARGYVDDAALADSVARRRTHNGYGKARIAADLRSRGVGAGDIAVVLEAVDETAEEEQALVVARSLWRRRGEEDDRHRQRRFSAAMQRRGYGCGLITRLLGTLGEEPGRRPEGAGPLVQ